MTELLPRLLRECTAEYDEMCGFLGEMFDTASFRAGYLAHATWRAEHERLSVLSGWFEQKARPRAASPIVN